MLVQIIWDLCPHRIKNKVDTFAPCQFCRWHKISVTSDKNDLINLLLKRQRRDIQTDPHVYAFLPEIVMDVSFSKVFKLLFS